MWPTTWTKGTEHGLTLKYGHLNTRLSLVIQWNKIVNKQARVEIYCYRNKSKAKYKENWGLVLL